MNGDVAEQLEVHPLDVIVEGFDQLEEQLNIFKESVTEKFELFTEPIEESIDTFVSIDAFHSLTEAVTENLKVVSATEEIDTEEASTSPIVQIMNMFGNLWESLAGISDNEESPKKLQQSVFHVSDSDVHLLIFLVFALVLSVLLCSS